MRRTQTNRQQTGGYTLIELLAVIAIIMLLIGLLLPAVQKFRAKGPEVETRSEIGQLELAIDGFKSTYQVNYLPSGFILAYNYNAPSSPAMTDSRQYFSKVWPKAFLVPGAAPDNVPGTGYTRTPPGTQILMDGNQALVFFLGGIPASNANIPAAWGGNYSGFLNSPTNPFNRDATGASCPSAGGGGTVKGPFFDFKVNRIGINGHYHDPHWRRTDPNATNENIYYYFSSKEGNDYQYFGGYAGILPGYNSTGGYGDTGIYRVDPYMGLDNKYLNAGKFQIISAGADHVAGPGGLYAPGQGSYRQGQDRMPGVRGGGFDDQANFSTALLGVSQ